MNRLLIAVATLFYMAATSCEKSTFVKKEPDPLVFAATPEPLVNGDWRKIGTLFSSQCDVRFLFSANEKSYYYVQGWTKGDGTPRPTLESNFYAFDHSNNTITAKRKLPSEQIGFWAVTIDNKGYFGAGFGLWEYDDAEDQWISKRGFPKYPCEFPNVFSVSGKAFLCSYQGANGLRTDDSVYEFDPIANKWSTKTSYVPGDIGYSAKVSFVINGTAYIVGHNWEGHRLYKYDHVKDEWEIKGLLPVSYEPQVMFASKNKGYIYCAAGAFNSIPMHDNFLFEYDPASDKWTKAKDFKGEARALAAGFAMGDRIYIGFGKTKDKFTNDLWEYNL